MRNPSGNNRSESEEMLNKLSKQITDLFSEIHYYQALVTEKDNQIIRLTLENSRLKMQIQEPSTPLNSSSPPIKQTPPTLTVPPLPRSTVIPGIDARVNKRQCPKCGAMGFAIKEVDDKSKIISYIPRRIYAKKKVCTKCRHEFN
jgi:hypothetical protein